MFFCGREGLRVHCGHDCTSCNVVATTVANLAIMVRHAISRCVICCGCHWHMASSWLPISKHQSQSYFLVGWICVRDCIHWGWWRGQCCDHARGHRGQTRVHSGKGHGRPEVHGGRHHVASRLASAAADTMAYIAFTATKHLSRAYVHSRKHHGKKLFLCLDWFT